jgi:hypothetical protein
MANRDVALEFLERFCEADIDGLERLMTKDVRVAGPLFSGDSRREYLRALREDPPERCGFSVVGVTEAVGSVSIFADYEKKDRTVRVAHLFRFTGQRIAEIVLVFDRGGY